ncbi:MAG: hypothetical protein SOX65_08975, partial [Porphyromonas sp.]|nr:hypothetical protein [Porphyromonas sp.]
MKLLSKARNRQKQKSNKPRRSFSVAPGLFSLVLCMSVLLLGACRKSPKEVTPGATDGNLTIQLNCRGVDLRAGENDPMSAAEKL